MSALKAAWDWAASSTLAHVAFGFVAMGGWAFFANRHHPFDQAFIAALVQGVISGSLTLVLKKALEWMNKNMDRRRPRRPALTVAGRERGAPRRMRGGAARSNLRTPAHAGEGAGGPYLLPLVLPPLVTATSILAVLIGAHTLAGTPEVLATIAVPFTVSTTYAILYNLRLWREAHGRR